MVLSFLCMAFVRVIQLVRFSCRAKDDMAIEIVMLRHEVAVLRRQVDDQRFGPLIAQFSPGCRDFSHGPVAEGSSSSRPTLLRWHRDLFRRRWTYPHRRSRDAPGAALSPKVLPLKQAEAPLTLPATGP
jgi:putative transposase